jgi:polysaccharide biosynthesis/export protein ExoF
VGKTAKFRRKYLTVHGGCTGTSLTAVVAAAWVGAIALPNVVFGSDAGKPAETMQRTGSGRPAQLVGEPGAAQPALLRSARALTAPKVASQLADLNIVGSELELLGAERVQLRVNGYPELNGDYRINPDQTISIAGLRRVPVDAMSVPDLEVYLSERLSASLRREISVSVEIARFRPYFVTGQVAAPGAVEWRPGLTLIQAISLAGGVSRSPTRGEIDTPERGLLTEQARAQQRFALAQLARLKAEKDGKASVEATRVMETLGDTSTSESRQALTTFIERQNQLLAEQREIMRGRITRLERERELAAREFETARQQEQEIAKTVEMSKEMAEKLEQLKDKQIITTSRYMGQQRDLIESRVRFGESRAQVERARGRVASLTREIETVQQERRAFLNDRIEMLERELAQLDLTLQDARPSQRASAQDAPPALSYYIARKTAAIDLKVSTGQDMSGLQTMAAHLFTEILPGDVVIVSSQARGPAEAAALAASNVNAGSDSALAKMQRIIESSAALRMAPTNAAQTGRSPPAVQMPGGQNN